MPIQRTITLYQFTELSDKAKERARAWWREMSQHDEFWDSVYDDASTIAEMMGIDLAQRESGRRRDGKPVYSVDIQFSGFCSQGDGASFTGTFHYQADALDKVKAHAPEDTALHKIVERLQAAHAVLDYKATGSITRSNWGGYVHARLMDVDLDEGEEDDTPENELKIENARVEFREVFRAYADWIYDGLEKEYEYQQSDEVVDDNITANDYTFEEDGARRD